MKRRTIGWLLVFPLAALAACQPGQRQDKDAPLTREDLINTQTQLAAKYDQAFAMADQLTDRVMRLESRVVALENEAKVKDVDIRTLSDKVARLMAAAGVGGPDGPAGAGVRPEEAQREIERQLQRLKDGLRKEEVAKAMQPASKYAAPRLCEALRGALRDPEFMKRIEYVLSQLPAADLKVPLEDALKDPIARFPAARVVGDVGNKDLSKILEPYTADASLHFCFLAGDGLVRSKNRLGVPALLRVLRADDANLRMLAVSTLSRLNDGRDFGYDFQRKPEENVAPIKAWEDWYEKEGPKLFP